MPLAQVLAPTRELAQQIYECSEPYAATVGCMISCIYGGAESYGQRDEIAEGVDLLIATPGRLMDFMNRRHVSLRRVMYFVIDEADRMLDMGFIPQVKKIVMGLSNKRQTQQFTATWPKEVERLTANICTNNPVKIKIGAENLTVNKDIKQVVEVVDEYLKENKLLRVLKDVVTDKTFKVLIFTKTKRTADKISQTLEFKGYDSRAIHGDKKQMDRDQIINDFKEGNINILVATDVASRGQDIKDVKVVINYDFSTSVEDYVHRIGRTGRAGTKGQSFTFFTKQDDKHAKSLCKLLEKCGKEVPDDLRNVADNARRNKRANFDRPDSKNIWDNAEAGFGGSNDQFGDRDNRGGHGNFGNRFGNSFGRGGGGDRDRTVEIPWTVDLEMSFFSEIAKIFSLRVEFITNYSRFTFKKNL